jgi:hypothetical protein
VEQLLAVEITKFIHLQVQELLQFQCWKSFGSNSVDYLVVAGGGGGGAEASTGGGGGGGGAGGLRYVFPQPATAGLPVTATGYPITVGGGGPAGNAAGGAQGGDGSNSSF